MVHKSGQSYFLGKFPLLLAHSKFRSEEGQCPWWPSTWVWFQTNKPLCWSLKWAVAHSSMLHHSLAEWRRTCTPPLCLSFLSYKMRITTHTEDKSRHITELLWGLNGKCMYIALHKAWNRVNVRRFIPMSGFKEVHGFKTNTYVMRSSWLPQASVNASLQRSRVPSCVLIQHPLGFSSLGSCPHCKACFPEVEDTCPHSWLPVKMECRCVTSLLQSDRAREPPIYKNNMQNPFHGKDSGPSFWCLGAAMREARVSRARYHGVSYNLAPGFSRTGCHCGLDFVPGLHLTLLSPLENLWTI